MDRDSTNNYEGFLLMEGGHALYVSKDRSQSVHKVSGYRSFIAVYDTVMCISKRPVICMPERRNQHEKK